MKNFKNCLLILYLNVLLLYPCIFVLNNFDPQGKIENIIIISIVTLVIFISCGIRLYSIRDRSDIIFRNLHLHIISILLSIPMVFLLSNYYFLLYLILFIMFNVFIYSSSFLTKNNIDLDEQNSIYKKALSLPIPLFFISNLIIKKLRVDYPISIINRAYLILFFLIMLIFTIQLVFLIKKSLKNK